MDSMYLENLDEYINDEGRIVTYKWLSLSLKVPANVAKQMLYHYVSKQRDSDKGDGLCVTYLVSGIEAGEDEQTDVHKVVLAREENLATTKSKLKNIVSVHVYSVSKSKLKDLNVLYTANYDEVKKNLSSINRYGGIECSSAKVRSSADVAKLQQQNAYQAPPEPAPFQKKPKPPQDKVTPKTEPVKEETTPKEYFGSKQGKKNNNQIASMFARQTVKSEEKKDEKKLDKPETTKPSSAGSKKPGGISAFFNKGPADKKPKTPDSSKSSPVKEESTKDSPLSSESSKVPLSESEATTSPAMTESLISSSIKTESQDSTTLESQTDSMEVDSSPPKKVKAKAKTQSKIKPKKASQKRGKSKQSDDESPIPKRKRIMAMSDSDSSSEGENEEEDESPLPGSPIPEPARIESDEEEIPATPQPEPKGERLSKNGKPKKRKLVPKTFMDDDGYIVTKKEYEYVTDSEEEAVHSNEENIPAKRNVESPKKTVSKSPQKKAAVKSPSKKHSKDLTKTKQSSIMSFFGKK